MTNSEKFELLQQMRNEPGLVHFNLIKTKELEILHKQYRNEIEKESEQEGYGYLPSKLSHLALERMIWNDCF